MCIFNMDLHTRQAEFGGIPILGRWSMDRELSKQERPSLIPLLPWLSQCNVEPLRGIVEVSFILRNTETTSSRIRLHLWKLGGLCGRTVRDYKPL